MPTNEILQDLMSFVQIVATDANVYCSGKPLVATAERKALVLSGIKLIKNRLEALEKIID